MEDLRKVQLMISYWEKDREKSNKNAILAIKNKQSNPPKHITIQLANKEKEVLVKKKLLLVSGSCTLKPQLDMDVF